MLVGGVFREEGNKGEKNGTTVIAKSIKYILKIIKPRSLKKKI